MSRPTTAGQDTALAASDRTTYLRVLVEDGDGAMVDLTDLEGVDFVDEVRIRADEDSPISQATVKLWREAEGVSIAPLIEASPANRDALDAYAPLIHPGRRVEVYTATVLSGAALAGEVMLWRGYVDNPAWGAGQRLVFTARDPGRILNGKIIETLMEFGDADNLVPVEDVMREILDEQFGVDVIPLRVIGDPDFGVFGYPLKNVSVLDALNALAALNGWALHYLWSEEDEDIVLTFYEPDRAGVTPAHTFGPDDYYEVPDIQLDETGMRNAGELLYTDEDGDPQTTVDERAGAADPLTRAFIRLDESGGVIRTEAQATKMLTAMMDDLSTPNISKRLDAAFWWPLELGDICTFTANDKHYDEDLTLAVFGYTHILSSTKRRTQIDAAGKPSAGFLRWHARAEREGLAERIEELIAKATVPSMTVSIAEQITATGRYGRVSGIFAPVAATWSTWERDGNWPTTDDTEDGPLDDAYIRAQNQSIAQPSYRRTVPPMTTRYVIARASNANGLPGARSTASMTSGAGGAGTEPPAITSFIVMTSPSWSYTELRFDHNATVEEDVASRYLIDITRRNVTLGYPAQTIVTDRSPKADATGTPANEGSYRDTGIFHSPGGAAQQLEYVITLRDTDTVYPDTQYQAQVTDTFPLLPPPPDE